MCVYYVFICEKIIFFVDEVIWFNVVFIDEEGVFLWKNLEVFIKVGWGNIFVLKVYSGLEFDYVVFVIVVEEIVKVCVFIVLVYVMYVGVI